MNKLFKVILIIVVLPGLISLPLLSQSRENGAIEGKVTTETGEPASGVTVKLTSPNMIGESITNITNVKGRYHFTALLPGIYTLETELGGFAPYKRTDIRVSVGRTITLDIQMELKTVVARVDVMGRPPLIDVKDSQQATTFLEKELLVNIPITRSYHNVVNLAPCVTDNDRLFGGAGGDYGTSYNIDGNNNSDPYFAGSWCLLDWNTIEEVKVGGIGANVEYDGFTGGIVDIVTKSGGNTTKGGVEFYYTGKKWRNRNTEGIDWEWEPEYSDVNTIDPSFFLGGAIKKNKLWYFVNFQYETHKGAIVDFPKNWSGWNPKVFGKLSAQLGKNDRLQATLSYETSHENYKNAEPGFPVEMSSNYRSDDQLYNISWLHIFSGRTFMEAKLAGWYANQSEIGNGGDAYPHADVMTDKPTENAAWSYDGQRFRIQANASITHHSDNFIKGSHDFKFGIEVEHATITEDYGFTNGRYYFDYYGEPYYFIEWEGYPLDGKINRISVYAQDSWSISDRLTINPGIRYNIYRMSLNGETVYKTDSLAPRIGITFDVFGDNTTAIKAHYGRYYDQLRITDVYPAMEIPDLKFYFWDWVAKEYFLDFIMPVGRARVDSNLRQPGVDQYSISIERELFKNFSIEVAYIYKKFINILGCVETLGRWEQVSYVDEYMGQTHNVWSLTTNPNELEYLITNPVGGTYDTVPFTPESIYRSIQLNIIKRFSKKWQFSASYAYSKADGNFDVGDWESRELLGNDFFISKNETVNSGGRNLSDATHVFKLQGSVILPLDIALGVNFIFRSGYRYNSFFRIFDVNIIDIGWGRDIRAESRGSLKYPDLYRLDLRLEKQLKIGRNKFSVLVDVYNLFNSNIILELQNHTFNPNYRKVSSIMPPRRYQLGVRFHF